jgi:hypothetical protein
MFALFLFIFSPSMPVLLFYCVLYIIPIIVLEVVVLLTTYLYTIFYNYISLFEFFLDQKNIAELEKCSEH